jgi:hypothetical protein
MSDLTLPQCKCASNAHPSLDFGLGEKSEQTSKRQPASPPPIPGREHYSFTPTTPSCQFEYRLNQVRELQGFKFSLHKFRKARSPISGQTLVLARARFLTLSLSLPLALPFSLPCVCVCACTRGIVWCCISLRPLTGVFDSGRAHFKDLNAQECRYLVA